MLSKEIIKLKKYSTLVFGFVLIVLAVSFITSCSSAPKPDYSITHRFNPPVDENKGFDIVNGIEVSSGLIAEGDWFLVKQTCTVCHSSKLITQNRATEHGWQKMIKWMQETQGLWDLGANEGKIVNYLAKHYAPEETGRRKNLKIVDWYDIE